MGSPSSTTSSKGRPPSSTSLPTTTTMSFARALVAAGPSARLAAGRVSASRSLALAYRWHSTAPRHQESLGQSQVRSPSSVTAHYTAVNEPGKDYDPYKDGPSAIDKAVHLFFFTEIIRGECHRPFLPRKNPSRSGSRHVARVGAVLPSSIHYHVSVREGPPFSSLPGRARSP